MDALVEAEDRYSLPPPANLSLGSCGCMLASPRELKNASAQAPPSMSPESGGWGRRVGFHSSPGDSTVQPERRTLGEMERPEYAGYQHRSC